MKMTKKQLIFALSRIPDDTELSLYVGGDDYAMDYDLDGIDFAEKSGQVVFKLPYDVACQIANEVDKNDMVNELDYLGLKADLDQIDEIYNQFTEALNLDEHHNQIYDTTLESVYWDVINKNKNNNK